MLRIPENIRRYIVDGLLMLGNMAGGGTYESFFSRVYPECKTIQYNRTTLINEIVRHCDSFPNDWEDDASKLEIVKIYEWPDEQFLYFCKEYVSPVFRRTVWNRDIECYEDQQKHCVDVINRYLPSCGYELKAARTVGDKTEYEIIELSGVKGKIQGIVFAAVYKPSVLLTDVLNHDVQIPHDDEKYLYYTDPVGNQFLKWSTLESWYDSSHVDWVDPSFTDRMKIAVEHCGSPIEVWFYEAYLELIEEMGKGIPALLPQVWMYYDEKSQKERIIKIFEHQCMDFMMLFSDSRRIVIELDGAQHYADEEPMEGYEHPIKIASPRKYAEMVSAHRDMTMAGYEVYRFGGSEFNNEDHGKTMVKQFFKDLFAKYGVDIEILHSR